MHIQRIRFDRVFDVQQRLGLFSFVSADGVTYSVHLPGRVIPREGATWAVAFGQPGDWSSLLGWRDLARQRTTLNYRLADLLFNIDLLWWTAVPVFVLCCWLGGPLAALAMVLAATAGGAWRLRHIVRRHRLVRSALRTS